MADTYTVTCNLLSPEQGIFRLSDPCLSVFIRGCFLTVSVLSETIYLDPVPRSRPCLYPQLLRPKAREHGITQQRSCLTTQPVVARRTAGRLLNQPTQTLKGFHNSDVCRTPSAFMDNPTPNPGCAARPGDLLLKSFGLGFTLKKSKGLRSKLWVKTNASARDRVKIDCPSLTLFEVALFTVENEFG